MIFGSISLLALLTVVLANPVARKMQIHESLKEPPAGFALKGPTPQGTTVQLRIALVQGDPEGLIEALMDTERFTSPTAETYTAVTSWLTDYGVASSNFSSNGQWLGLSLPVEQANTLFDAQFSVFTHTGTGIDLVRTLSYSVPSDLAGHIDLVHPTTTFVAQLNGGGPSLVPLSASTKEDDNAPTSCNETITPACLQDLYGIPITPASQPNNILGVSGFGDQWAGDADIKKYLEMFRPDIDPSTMYTLTEVDGGRDPQIPGDAGDEADLDLEITLGLATNVSINFISVGRENHDGASGFLDQINYLLNQDTVPAVLTTSYGFDETTISMSLANTMCQAYAALGARGTSLIFASGDGGVGGNHPQLCTDFIATFPSSCPYVTSVGATTNVAPEVAANFSGGGFSTYFARPSYQSAAVPAFLATLGTTYAGRYNTTGRGYPDVSAQGGDFAMVFRGRVAGAGGTSASAPTVAAIVALLNDRLLAAGKPVLGFLNPFLYAAGAAAFTDVTAGSADGCGTAGFSAVEGWDPITGLGTPRFADLVTAAGL